MHVIKKRKSTKAAAKSSSSFSNTPCPIVPFEQFQFALSVAGAASQMNPPPKSFMSNYEEAIDQGTIDRNEPRWVMKDTPENHAAFAIMNAFPDRTEEGDELRQALLWRVMFAFGAVYRDSRSAIYKKEVDGVPNIALNLVEAVATTPMNFGAEIPLDEIFANAQALIPKYRNSPS